MWNYAGLCNSYISYRTLFLKLTLLYVLNANYRILFMKVPFLGSVCNEFINVSRGGADVLGLILGGFSVMELRDSLI